jgi:hypothetical protein
MNIDTQYQIEKGEKSSWFTVLESQSLTADVRSDVQKNLHAQGLLLEIITSAGSGSPIFTPVLETVDPDGNKIALWTAAATITTNTSTIFLFYPGAASDADGVTEDADMPIPREWNLFLDWTSGTSVTVVAHACYL